MIDIKLYSKSSNLRNVYEFTAYCYKNLQAGAYFRHNGHEYLITSDPVYQEDKETEPSISEANFMAVQIGSYLMA
ncbi:hypothetical protein FEM33_17585 [Dyadobacter flavalbus]|uniref:Uncharacterized protein n=1 Tax=Dyadobacter flavalbus TaxID=2579942 RepID=A0A5M8QQZ2_9BACT|nr:hypothetical protein [Dyadobacter flavalbus]KAA6438499.1 hypothetical protein FEM33_17585 [Dyadobacter flavalbus]